MISVSYLDSSAIPLANCEVVISKATVSLGGGIREYSPAKFLWGRDVPESSIA
jgi:hypothetical protein